MKVFYAQGAGGEELDKPTFLISEISDVNCHMKLFSIWETSYNFLVNAQVGESVQFKKLKNYY